MTDDLTALRAQHRPNAVTEHFCLGCQEDWPCRITRVLDRLERAEAAIEHVRAEVEYMLLEGTVPLNDWNLALDYAAKRVLAALDTGKETGHVDS